MGGRLPAARQRLQHPLEIPTTFLQRTATACSPPRAPPSPAEPEEIPPASPGVPRGSLREAARPHPAPGALSTAGDGTGKGGVLTPRGDATGGEVPSWGRAPHPRRGATGGTHACGAGGVGNSRGRARGSRGGGTTPLPTFLGAQGPRWPPRRWHRMQIRRLTSGIMWLLA